MRLTKKRLQKNPKGVSRACERRNHDHDSDEGLQAIRWYVGTCQQELQRARKRCEHRYITHVLSTLILLESMHREVMSRTRCDDCLAEFKRKKFYVLDEAGFEYSAEGLVDRRTAIAS